MSLLNRVLPFFALIVIGFSLVFAVPTMVAMSLGETAALQFIIGWVVCFSSGALLLLLNNGLSLKLPDLRPRDGILLVSMCWTILPAYSAIPLYLYFQATERPISIVFAYFEAVSAITTTGATVLTGLEHLPYSINLWRCGLQWIGGMGILVLAVAILPMVSSGAGQLFRAESTGPLKEVKLTPRIAETAKGLWGVYSLFSLSCLIAYRLGGMNWGDAWLHMFTTMSLGGLSSYDSSFAAFQSPTLEWICIFYMFLASGSFALYFVAIVKGDIRSVFRDPEWQGSMLIMIVASAFIAGLLILRQVLEDPLTAIRTATFNVVSIASTTGYSTTDFSQWPIFAPVLMLLLSGVATSAGSTGAGIKMARLMILLKQVRRETFRLLHPRAIHPLVINGESVRNETVFSVMAFMLVYGGSILLMTLVLLLTDNNLVIAFSAVVACINNMGPGLNEIGPAGNFTVFDSFELLVLSLAMIIGRLEIMAFLAIFTLEFWKE
jgi:trk system potassium uptake protein TrkH